MGRPTIKITIPQNVKTYLQMYANINENITKVNEMTDYPEIAELLESQNSATNTVHDFLCKELNIVGHVDKQFLQNEEEYYEDNGLLKENYEKRYSN